MSSSKLIANRYEIKNLQSDLLGKGGMGEVYRAHDTQTGNIVAVKLLKSDVVNSSPEIVTRFVREGEALRQLNHPNIVKMLDAVEEGDCHYLIVEYVKGGSLRELLDREGPLPVQLAIKMSLELADALTRAHHLNIIHRDLKPANILLTEENSLRLTDFGIAQLANGPRLTQSGIMMGTPNYLSPEACQGEKLDARADIWAFGVILYEMLTGEIPFSGENILNVVIAILNEESPDIAIRRSDISASLIELINQMMEKDREKRLPSVRLVGAQLEAILHGRDVAQHLGQSAAQLFPSVVFPEIPQYHGRSNHLTQLREKIERHFNLEELKTICFDLRVDFDSLPGSGKGAKVRELLAQCERSDQIQDLVVVCSGHRPKVVWTLQTQLFICYKRRSALDNQLAVYLRDKLMEKGHQVFIDQSMRSGVKWLEEIDRQIRGADFMIVLLSKESADSEMVQSEIRRAYEYRSQQGYPHILPVRVVYEGLLPYSIDAFLNPFQYIVWEGKQDNDRIIADILLAIESNLPNKQPVRPAASAFHEFSEDGRLMSGESTRPPLPEFDQRLLDDLIAPGGALHIRDKFYVERIDDHQLKKQMERPGTITTIRASRQTGKSSLLVRGIKHARQQKAKVVNLDLQRVDRENLKTADSFLYYLAETIVRKLRLDINELQQAWKSSMGPQDKLTYLIEDYVLQEVNSPILLAMDEVDRLLDSDYQTDFFALMRSWHNNAAYDELWELLSIIMVISTEPYLLIADVNQSPFNVGLKLSLKDFNEAQVQDLNGRHNIPVSPSHFADLMTLLNGQPYLTRMALYTLVTSKMSWSEFMRIAPSDQGPFGDHLRRQQWLLQDDPTLRPALKQIVRNEKCDDKTARYRLLRAGLIKGSGDHFTCRCDLYRRYFKDKL